MKKALTLALALFLCLQLVPMAALADYETYSVTLENDDAHGTVLYRAYDCTSGLLEYDSIRYGDTLLMEAQPNDGWMLGAVSAWQDATGEPAAITVSGNTITVEILASSTVSVAYQPVEAPAITAQPQSAAVTEGENAVFNVEAKGEALRYQWYSVSPKDAIGKIKPERERLAREGAEAAPVQDSITPMKYGGISGANTATLTIQNAPAALDGLVYYCVVANAAGEAKSEPATLTVREAKPEQGAAPVITADPQPLSVHEGSRVEFTVAAQGENLHYEWKMVDAGVPAVVGTDSPTLVVTESAEYTYHNSYDFWCRVWNEYGEAESAKAHLRVFLPEEIVITRQPQDIVVKEGEPLDFSIAATGENIHYRWSVCFGEDTETFFDELMNVPAFRYTNESMYDTHNGIEVYCYLFNENSEVTSDVAHVTVIPNPKPVNPFTDVSESDWFYNDVLSAVSMGLIDGETATTYAPGKNLTVAAAIKLAACLHERYNTGAVTLKNGTGNWYDTYVAYAEQNGIIAKGAWAGHYNDAATRAQFVGIFYPALPNANYVDNNPVADDAIPDVPISESWAGPVYAFYRAGILTGSDQTGRFNPDASILRSEVAAILTRMLDPTARRFVVLPRPDASLLDIPTCWTAAEDRFVFFTVRDGLPAVEHGTWGFSGTRDASYITSVTRSGDTVTVSTYNPPLSEPADAQDTLPWFDSYTVDLSNLDNDGKIKIAINEGPAVQFGFGGSTREEAYDSVHG